MSDRKWAREWLQLAIGEQALRRSTVDTLLDQKLIHAQQDGAQHPLGQRTQRGALPVDRAPGDHQPDDADHEEQRDEVMQAAAVAVSPMYIPGICVPPPF